MRWRHLLATTAAVAAAVGVSSAPTGAQLGDAESTITWLATGDSYSSGEGIAGTGTAEDDFCAQSDDAYGPKAAQILRDSRDWQIDEVVFNACTGAVVENFYHGWERIPFGASQWAWAEFQGVPAGGRFDVITMSYGGNDIGFDDIVKDCLTLPTTLGGVWDDPDLDDGGCSQPLGNLRGELDRLRSPDAFPVIGPDGSPGDGRGGSLAEFYRTLVDNHLADDGVLVVVGYPRLFAPSAEWGAWRNDRCSFFVAEEADQLGELAEEFDQTLRELVAEADPTGERIRYVSRLTLFDDNGRSHSVCAPRNQWMNGVSVGFWDSSLRKEHSFHPNEIGHSATAERVAGELAAVDRERAAARAEPAAVPDQATPTTPTPPPEPEPEIRSEPRYDVGEPFAAQCVIAWPWAPVHTSETTQMRMSCGGVPSQFTFVQVIYPDPDLQMTSDPVIVYGEIVDYAIPEFGFQSLVVVASEIDFTP